GRSPIVATISLPDGASDLSDTVVSFVRASQEIIIVVCDEPSSITDAYALIKLLNIEHGVFRFRVIANMTRTTQEGINLFNKLNRDRKSTRLNSSHVKIS